MIDYLIVLLIGVVIGWIANSLHTNDPFEQAIKHHIQLLECHEKQVDKISAKLEKYDKDHS